MVFSLLPDHTYKVVLSIVLDAESATWLIITVVIFVSSLKANHIKLAFNNQIQNNAETKQK